MDKTKIRKDLMTIYMFRNAFATLFVVFVSFMISLMNFYQCSLVEALQRLLIHDLYTVLYFILLWVFNYLIFEVSKILYDIYKEKVTFVPCLILMGLCILIFFLPILDLFQYNFSFLLLLIIVRMMKEMRKRTPSLFHRLSMKKRPQ